MDWKELKDSLLKGFEERISSPVLGTFAFSWLFFNWRAAVVLVFASNQAISQRFSTIDKDLGYAESWSWEQHPQFFWYPFCATVLIILFLPALNGLAGLIKKAWDVGIGIVLEKIEKKERIPREKYDELLVELEKSQSTFRKYRMEYDTERELFQKEISGSRENNENLIQEISDLQEKNKSLQNNLQREQEEKQKIADDLGTRNELTETIKAENHHLRTEIEKLKKDWPFLRNSFTRADLIQLKRLPLGRLNFSDLIKITDLADQQGDFTPPYLKMILPHLSSFEKYFLLNCLFSRMDPDGRNKFKAISAAVHETVMRSAETILSNPKPDKIEMEELNMLNRRASAESARLDGLLLEVQHLLRNPEIGMFEIATALLATQNEQSNHALLAIKQHFGRT